MKNIKFSLIDDDYKVQTETDLEMNEKQIRQMAGFFNQIARQLATGQEAHFEIDGLETDSVVFTIKNEELISPGV